VTDFFKARPSNYLSVISTISTPLHAVIKTFWRSHIVLHFCISFVSILQFAHILWMDLSSDFK
jgi:hypothetical protein